MARRTSDPFRNAEIILKENYIIDDTGRIPYPVPNLTILANAAGFRYLAEFFLAISEHTDGSEDNHEHLGRMEWPFSPQLSDDLEFRLVLITPEGRKEVLKYNGVNRVAVGRRSLIPRYQRIIDEVGAKVSAIRKRRREDRNWLRKIKIPLPAMSRVQNESTRRRVRKHAKGPRRV